MIFAFVSVSFFALDCLLILVQLHDWCRKLICSSYQQLVAKVSNFLLNIVLSQPFSLKRSLFSTLHYVSLFSLNKPFLF